MDFNIHNLLHFRINSLNQKYLDYFCKEYSYFKTESDLDPDIEIEITDAIHYNTNYHLVNQKYFIKDGHLHCRDRYKIARWDLSMDDLEGRSIVRFNGGIWGEHILKDSIIEPLIGFKLATKGFSMLHASAIAIDDAGVIFAGGPESGKTSSLLSLNGDNNVFLSDEITLLSREGVIYSFPTPVRAYYYNLRSKTGALNNLTSRLKFEALIKHAVHFLSSGYLKFTVNIAADKLFKRTGGVYPLRRLIFLTRTSGDDIDVTEISDKTALIERLALMSEQQFPYWGKYVSAYSSVFPSSQLANYQQVMRKHLSAALDRVSCYEFKTPRKFLEKHSDKFRQVIQTLGKDG